MCQRAVERSPGERRLVMGIFRLVLGVCFAVSPVVSQAFADDSSQLFSEMLRGVREYTLPNGLRVVMYNRGSAPVFAGAVVVRVGGSDEQLGETGISHIFEHMAFKGSRTIGTKNYALEKQLLERLEQIARESKGGTALSPEQRKEWDDLHQQLGELWISDDFTRRYEKQGAVGQNATTDKEFTKYFVNLPRSAFELWCKLEADRLLNPVMRQFYQERDVVLEERRMRFEDDPAGRLYELLLGVAYQQHPYRFPVIGYERDIRSITAHKVNEFRKRYYTPGNMVVSVVGRVNPDEDIKVIQEYFGALPPGPTIERDIPTEPVQQGERRVSIAMKAAPQIVFAYTKPAYPHPDDTAISVMSEILSGGKISPLYTELVKKRQIAASIDHEEGPGVVYPNLLMFSATVKAPHLPSDVEQGFDLVIQRFKKNGATQEQVDMAKRAIAMAYLSHLQSNQSLATDFASSQLAFGSWRASFEWYEKMNQVEVSDVMRVAATYLRPERRTIATIERAP